MHEKKPAARRRRIIRTVLVDDNPAMIRLLSRLLGRRHDLQVVGVASDADEALQQAKVLEPDLMLVDVNMPGKSGLELTCELRRSLPGIRVILMTALDLPESRLAVEYSGACGFVPKSRLLQELPAMIHNLFPC